MTSKNYEKIRDTITELIDKTYCPDILIPPDKTTSALMCLQ